MSMRAIVGSGPKRSLARPQRTFDKKEAKLYVDASSPAYTPTTFSGTHEATMTGANGKSSVTAIGSLTVTSIRRTTGYHGNDGGVGRTASHIAWSKLQ